MASKRPQIDPGKLHATLRKLGNEQVFLMLHDAIALLPPAKLHKLIKQHIDLERLRPDTNQTDKPGVLQEVKRFEKSSLAGDFFESFHVDSRNYQETSPGTRAWMADHNRLLERCVVESKDGNPAEVRQAMDTLFGLLDHIDKGNDDIIFFADEGGSWQVGVDWLRILPAWFKVLSATAGPKEYAERITSLISRHCAYDRVKLLAIARRAATPDQRKALRETDPA